VSVLAWGRSAVRSRRLGLLSLSLGAGVGAGLGAVVFRFMIQGLTRLFTGYDDYAAVPHSPHCWLPGVGQWFVVAAPVVAGLLYGPLVYRFAREARGHGVPEVMLAVARNGGRIRPQVAVVKALASALCIAGGGSVGREGPIVQIGSAHGFVVGRRPRVRLRDPRPGRRRRSCCHRGGTDQRAPRRSATQHHGHRRPPGPRRAMSVSEKVGSMSFQELIELVGKAVDVGGVGIVVVGVVVATVLALRMLLERQKGAYESYRRLLGRSILLGLESWSPRTSSARWR